MQGRRYLLASETKAGKSLDEQLIKQLTGGDMITARFLRAEWFEFRPVGKIHLTSNHAVAVSDDDATWRRIHLIKWEQVIPEEEQDPDLAANIIRDEGPGVLAWLVRGAMHWHEVGLRAPDKATADKAEYRKDEDTLGRFIVECLDEVEPATRAVGRSVQEIYALYKYWAIANGHAVMSQKSLTSRLKVKGNEYDDSSHTWRGFPALQVKMALTESS